MRISRLALIPLAALAAGFCLPAAAQQKIAVVDLEKLVRLHPNTKHDKEVLETTLKEFTAQKEEIEASVIRARKAYLEAGKETRNPALSEKARKAKEEEALAKRDAALEIERDAQEKVRSLQRKLTETETAMLKVTTGDIQKAIRAYAEEKQIDLVVQLPATHIGSSSGIVFAKKELDITPAIMQLIGIVEPENEEDEKDEKEGTDAGAPAAAPKAAATEDAAPAAPAK